MRNREFFSKFRRMNAKRNAKRNPEVRARPEKFPRWRVEDDMLYKYTSDHLLDPITNCEECWRLVVPIDYRERVLGDAHREASSGHFGVAKTYDRIAREYY